MQTRGTAVRGSLERYKFGCANDHQLPKHKLSESEVRMGMRSVDPSRTWKGGNGSRRRTIRGNASATGQSFSGW